MAKQKQPLEPVGPGLTFDAREANAAGYMAKMAGYANRGALAESTLLRLQMPSQTVQGLGLPDLVLRKDEHGRWYVFDRADASVPVRPEQSNAVSNTDAPVRPETEAGFDKKAYQREYMRAKRAKERGE